MTVRFLGTSDLRVEPVPRTRPGVLLAALSFCRGDNVGALWTTVRFGSMRLSQDGHHCVSKSMDEKCGLKGKIIAGGRQVDIRLYVYTSAEIEIQKSHGQSLSQLSQIDGEKYYYIQLPDLAFPFPRKAPPRESGIISAPRSSACVLPVSSNDHPIPRISQSIILTIQCTLHFSLRYCCG